MTNTLPLRLALLVSLLADAKSSSVLFEDKFDPNLSAGWAWVREDRDDWRVAAGTVQVRLTPGNLWEKDNTARNLLLRPPPDGEKSFTAEVTVSHTPATFGEQAGLLWYRDDDNYIKLVKEFYDGRTWAVFAVERDGKADYREADCRAQWVTMRLTIAGDKVTGEFLPVGGTDWKAMGDFTFPPRDEKSAARIGLTAHHGPADAPRWAHFRDFRITALQGEAAGSAPR
jgi:regulation of enolase protein 1 (concanavalin A-like superfamily)